MSDASLEHWSLVSDGAFISSFGRYQAPERKPRTVRMKGRCAYVNLKYKNRKVDAMVAAAFLPAPGACDDKLIHIDGDCHNDRADNLKWVPKDYKNRCAYACTDQDHDDMECLTEHESNEIFNSNVEPTSRTEYKRWAAACSAVIMMASV
jgi:hypothetical protein